MTERTTDREILEALVRALVGPDGYPSRFSWLEGHKAQVDAVQEGNAAFREAMYGDDPLAALECDREVADLLWDVRPALVAAARHLGIETPEFGSAEDGSPVELDDAHDPSPGIPF